MDLSRTQSLRASGLALWRSSWLPAFFVWWHDELLGLLPARWRRLLNPPRQVRWVHWRDDMPDDAPKTDETKQVEHILVLPADQALICPLQLPLTAARDLNAVLAFEMDKYTPFKVDQVYFAAQRLDSEDPAQLELQLVVILRDRLDKLLDNLPLSTPLFDGVDIADQNGQPLGINLAPAHRLRPKPLSQRYLERTLALVVVSLIVIAMQLWLHNRQGVVEQMQVQVSDLQRQVLQMQTLAAQLDGVQQTGRVVQAREDSKPALGAVLSDLSSCVPGHTWVEQLDITAEGQVNLSGESSKISELINDLKHCHQVINPQFQGTIQTDTATGKERFYLQLSIPTRDADHAHAKTL